MGLIELSRSRFEQYKNCLLILLLQVFYTFFGDFWEEIVFLKGLVKLGEIRNLGDFMLFEN